MPQVITQSIKSLVDSANAEVRVISVQDATDFLNSDDHVFVDLRDHRELLRSGKIPDAFSCPRGMLEFWIDPDSPYHKPIFAQDKTFVFYCASGWRSALASKAAQDMGLSPVCHIDGGFTAWTDAEFDVETIDTK